MNMFDRECLGSALQSEHEIIASWGAYQILQLSKEEIAGFIPFFLCSPFPDILDVGIAQIAELELHEHATDILKVFRESEGQTKYSAALALAQFPNDFSKSLIQKWFDSLISSDQSTRIEFEAATFAYLQIDRNKHFPLVMRALDLSQKDAIKSSVLFSYLLMFCEEPREFESIIDSYFILRDLHSDAEITFKLIEYFDCLELKDWLAENIAKGYSISSIFEQTCSLLDFNDLLLCRTFWNDIDQAYGLFDIIRPITPTDFPLFITGINKWVDVLRDNVENRSELIGLAAVLNAFLQHQDNFEKTIPKILEMECHFLLTIPIQIMMNQAVSTWLKEPTKNLDNIARYYHSSLLTKEFRDEILWMFFPEIPKWSEEQVKIREIYSPIGSDDRKHEVLWSFFRGELLGYDIPWPLIFPNPEYSFYLSNCLFLIYFYNFEYYINKRDRIAIDYALQLFQLHPEKKLTTLLQKHFDYLYDRHTETFYQTLEYLPDPAFFDLLVRKFQKDEYELAKLIFIISELFDLKIPNEISEEINQLKASNFHGSGIKKPVRLYCGNCGSAFQYPVDLVYIDEGAIIRMNKLSSESVWAPQKFICKKCSANVPFMLDDAQLNEFSLQSRVDRLLRLTLQTKRSQFERRIVLIDFPRHKGSVYTPAAFEDFVAKYEKSPDKKPNQLKTLWMKQAKMYKAMRKWELCLNFLKKVEAPSQRIEIEWYFLMGLANYKLSRFADSRIFFDHLVKNLSDKGEESAALIEQAKYFLKTLDSTESKRARLKVITRKR